MFFLLILSVATCKVGGTLMTNQILITLTLTKLVGVFLLQIKRRNNMTDEQIKLIKDKFIENYIIVTPFQNQSNEVDFRYTDGNVQARRTIHTLKRRMQKVRFFRDKTFIYKAILSVISEVVYNFKPKDDEFDWNKVNLNESSENVQLHKYVFNGLKHKLDEVATDLGAKKPIIIDGQRYFLEFEGEQFLSLDEVLEDEDGEEYTMHEIVTDGNNFFLANCAETEDSHFWRWFRENKGEVEFVNGKYEVVKNGFLTKTQLIYLANDGDWEKYDRKKRSYFNKAIAKRTHTKFKESFPDTEIDRAKVFNIKQAIDFLNHIILMTEGKGNVGQLLSEWIGVNTKNYAVMTFVKDYLSKYTFDLNTVIYTKGKLALKDELAAEIIQFGTQELKRLYELQIKSLDSDLQEKRIQIDYETKSGIATRSVVINSFGVQRFK